jgi:hypothetical protein
MINEYYVILDLESPNLYLDDKGQLVDFKLAKEFFSKIDAGKYLLENTYPGQYTIITVYRVIEY